MPSDDPNGATNHSGDQTQSRWNDVMAFLGSWSKAWITAASLQLVVVVGVIDLVTGYEVSVSLFYLLPVSLSTWFAGRATGASVAAFSTVVWLAADLVRRPHYHHPLTPVWNALIMGLWFAVVVTLLDVLRWTYANLEATVLHRTEKLQNEIEERCRVEEQLTQTNADLRVIRQQLQESLDDLRKSHTELQHTQLQLIEAAKMEFIGRMAAGIAHEVKNPLMTLSLGADYLFERGSARHDEVELLKDMKDAVQRASGIINLLMDYSKPRPLQLVNEDVNSIIESSLELMRHQLIKQNVSVVQQLQGGLPPLLLDKRRMQHVFLNLFTNAVQAMSNGGRLTVRTRGEADPISQAAGGATGSGSGRVIVEVEDTGPGVPPEHIASLFEPFFTTKGTGEGTGLGLSIVQRIVRIHGGSISAGNCPEGGARFVLTFTYRAKG